MAPCYRRESDAVTHPIPGFQITTPWGTRGDWQLGYHTGDDYSTHGAVGIPVLASHSGRVIGTGNVWGRSFGLQVVTLGPAGRIQVGYCHLRDLSVRQGDEVEAGHLIGFSGNSGRTTGPHLHYEERRAPFHLADNRRPKFNRRP